MKSLLAIIALVSLATVPSLSQAQTVAAGSQWSGSLYYDLHSRVTSSIVSYKVTTFTNIFGKSNFALDFSGFGGVSLSNSTPVAGFLFSKSEPLAAGVFLTEGIGYSVLNGKPAGVGLEIGLSVKF